MEDQLIDNAGTAEDSGAPTGTTGDWQEEAADWKEVAGVQDNPAFQRFNSSADLAKSYTELERRQHDQLRFPSEEAGEETHTKFNDKMADHGFYPTPDQDNAESTRRIQTALGMPKDAASYQFAEVAGYEGDPESEGAFKSVAHDLGLTSAQANGIHQWLGNNIAETQGGMSEALNNGLSELKGEWGQAFDHKVTAAENTVNRLEEKVPGIMNVFNSVQGSGANADFIRLMDVVGEMLGESGAMPSDPRMTMTKDEAMSRIIEIQNNPDHPANPANEGKRGYEEAREKYMGLYKSAYS